jgi:cytochrome P450
MVMLLWGSANRDESVFERPDDVIVGRANDRLHLGFGRGIHYCVGAPLARLEVRVVVTKLLERSVSFELGAVAAPEWVDSLWARRHERLPLAIRWR